MSTAIAIAGGAEPILLPQTGVRASLRRIGALVVRYIYLLRSSGVRLVELIYWPFLQMLTWGFLQKYLAGTTSPYAQGAGVLIGSVLLSRGAAAAGLGLLLGWSVVLSLRALLAWEARRMEAEADLATVRASLGWHLHEALETLALAAPARPRGVLGFLVRPGTPLPKRAARVWQAITSS